MATLETTLNENGTRTLRKHFLNVRDTAKSSWHERRRFGY